MPKPRVDQGRRSVASLSLAALGLWASPVVAGDLRSHRQKSKYTRKKGKRK